MRNSRFLLVIASLLPAANALAHSNLNHIAPMAVAGNGGLAWLQFIALNVLPFAI